MRRITALALALITPCAYAGEYRFQCMGEVIGLCDSVCDQDGKETTIKISPDSDLEARAVFLALQKKRIYGTKGFKEDRGARWEQGIYLIGEFVSETKLTEGGPHTAPSEPYRDFKMTGIKLVFPVWRFVDDRGEDPSALPVFMETHFSFHTLLPEGLELNGKPIDLAKHAIDRTNVKQ